MLTHRPGQGSGRAGRLLGPAALAALLLAGCGGESQQARSPCPRLVSGAVGRLDERAPDLLTCTYRRGGAPLVRVTLDRAPQASFRFERTVVERSQAHLGDDAAQLPQEVAGVGRGADWIAAPRILLATDDRTLVTVAVLSPPRRAAADRATAIAVASVALRG